MKKQGQWEDLHIPRRWDTIQNMQFKLGTIKLIIESCIVKNYAYIA